MDIALPATPLPAAPALVTGKTFGIRVAAYILDGIYAFAVNLVIGLGVGFTVGLVMAILGQRLSVDPQTPWVASFVVGVIVGALFHTLYEWLYGATPGKLILGLRVVMEGGEPCAFMPAFKRAWWLYIDGLFLGLVALRTMKPPLYQRLGDKSAKTLVVGSKDEYIKQPRAWWWFLVATGIYLVVVIVETLFLLVIRLL
jgi:uncharacterized RDD family membrane protein YckC